ncbi:DUF4232 domain-containing protein [Streptomyces sp. WMMC897]|uniref:DUF4232 domain-containing protein n=1 Tax=Streptomyces sp. WMMC897 TaxID=3014782 RepID=UPI0022B7394C|nr:DUF4232 domain-containing protein [Streptomyces sp. WMMC897]MCZ7415236.1 DUF4232 domain-containing protein [Streptomyces sp. WMMC897]
MRRRRLTARPAARRLCVPLAACAALLTGCGVEPTVTPSPAGDGPPTREYSVEADELHRDGFDAPTGGDRALPPPPPPASVPNPLPADPLPLDPTPSPEPITCPDSGVRITTPWPPEAAMGLRAMGLTLTNCGDTPYTVEGYPEARVLDAERRPVDVQVLDGTGRIAGIGGEDGAVRRVTLQPGESAQASVVWRNTVEFGDVVHAPHLDVAPGAGEPWHTLTPDGGLDLGTTGRIALSPWHPAP